MMSEWLRLNRGDFNGKTRRKIRGVEVVVFLSPYDTPEAVRGCFDKSSNRFGIDLKYVGGPEEPNEPLDKVVQDEHIALQVGRRSHRLYRIEVDVESLGAEEVGLHILENVGEAIDRLASERERPENRGHYEVTKRAISECGKELLKDLVPA